jgi:hypothetical protein
MDIAQLRLHNQHIARTRLKSPADVVRWFGAVQAQDFLGSLWALGLRMKNAVESTVEQAVNDRTIVRSWPLRGTLHYTAAEDMRWMVELVGPRTIARAASRYRQLELNEATFAKSKQVLARALKGDQQLTRPELASALNKAGIATGDQRLPHILGRCALDGLICYAARRGKQFTFALLDEWVPTARKLTRDESLAELARRYFTSHGPATFQDYLWWTGLTAADARAGLEMVQPELTREDSDGQTYWLVAPAKTTPVESPTAWLLPPFDEYTVAYKDRRAVIDPAYNGRLSNLLSPVIVVDGQGVGTWTRTIGRGKVSIKTVPFTKFSGAEKLAIEEAAGRYGDFLGLGVEMM